MARRACPRVGGGAVTAWVTGFVGRLSRGAKVVQESGTAWRDQARQRLQAWPRVRNGTRPQAAFRGLRRPMRRQGARLLQAGQTCGVVNTAGVGREGLTGYEALGTCGRVEGGEPTNHAAARARRPGGVGRNGSVGTQSAHGAPGVEAIMTVVATLTQQHRAVLASMTAVCQAAYMGAPAPALLPCDPEAQTELPAVA